VLTGSDSAVRKTEIEPGRLVAIFGCGGLGYYAIQFAKLYGARVVAVDINDEKLKLGADFVVRADYDPPKFIQEIGGADACLNFSPPPWRMDQPMAISLIGINMVRL